MTTTRPPLFGRACSVALFVLTLLAASGAQTTSTLQGTVINTITREPINHALVFSPDHRFATATDDRGHFEFTLPTANGKALRPESLMARRAGFLEPDGDAAQIMVGNRREITLTLVPEALILGRVVLSSADSPGRIRVTLFRKQVQEGRPHWVPAAEGMTRANGEFRFAELKAGAYRLFTRESVDRDPQDIAPGGQLYGYPPVYFPAASDFDSSAILQLSPGRSVETEIKLVKQPYYPVRLAVSNAVAGIVVSVAPNGSSGPGFELGYSESTHAVTGFLPNGTYRVEAVSYGQAPLAGAAIITVNGGPSQGGPLTLLPGRSIPIEVTTQFKSEVNPNPAFSISPSRQGVRAVLNNVFLRPVADDRIPPGSTRPPERGDEPLLLEQVLPGRYWVHALPFRGYVAAMTSGDVDLLQSPLDVQLGVASAPIEVTLRDASASIHGVMEGSPAETSAHASTVASGDQPYAYIYCVPVPGSSGEYAEVPVTSTGQFDSQPLAPGLYRVLAFKTPQRELEYRNPDAMRAYDSRGIVVRLVDDQSEKLRLPLISAE